jgi:hypothetical protein
MKKLVPTLALYCLAAAAPLKLCTRPARKTFAS